MKPRFANPHFVAQSHQLVTRSHVFDEDPKVQYASAGEGSDYQEDLSWLEAYVKSSFTFHQEPAKRRKTSQAALVGESPNELPAFRLVSTRLLPQCICLEPKPSKFLNPIEPSYEDNDAEAETRRQQAEAIAVDSTWLAKEAQMVFPERKPQMIKAYQTIHSDLPPMLVTECQTNFTEDDDPLKRPHGPSKKACCPLLTVTTTPSSAEAPPRRWRRAKQAKTRERPPPQFFRPHRAWGGKSAGYAMGYEGSWPVDEHDVVDKRYVRDRMKKGVMSGFTDFSQLRRRKTR